MYVKISDRTVKITDEFLMTVSSLLGV
jgi:hypothetical protein